MLQQEDKQWKKKGDVLGFAYKGDKIFKLLIGFFSEKNCGWALDTIRLEPGYIPAYGISETKIPLYTPEEIQKLLIKEVLEERNGVIINGKNSYFKKRLGSRQAGV
jgi:hypothetical protein